VKAQSPLKELSGQGPRNCAASALTVRRSNSASSAVTNQRLNQTLAKDINQRRFLVS